MYHKNYTYMSIHCKYKCIYKEDIQQCIPGHFIQTIFIVLNQDLENMQKMSLKLIFNFSEGALNCLFSLLFHI